MTKKELLERIAAKQNVKERRARDLLDDFIKTGAIIQQNDRDKFNLHDKPRFDENLFSDEIRSLP